MTDTQHGGGFAAETLAEAKNEAGKASFLLHSGDVTDDGVVYMSTGAAGPKEKRVLYEFSLY